jgi:hypothetical protein
MNTLDITKAKADIDAILAQHQGSKASIAFGFDLYQEFAKRGWFTMETFTVGGTDAFPFEVPAYERSHFAYAAWGLPEEEFRVGPDV